MEVEMNHQDLYNDAWHKLLAARQQGDLAQVHVWAEEVAHHARVLEREQHSHHGVICSHTFDSRGVCTRCGYNASQI